MTETFQALASPVRRQILTLLKEGEMSAGEIADRLTVSKPTLSGHFNILKAADLVSARRDGTTITYRLNASVLEEVLVGFLDMIGLKNPGAGRADDIKEAKE